MGLTGIARLASLSPSLLKKQAIEYKHLPTRSWLNRSLGGRRFFDWAINPYRGCEFGCKYCYARYTHEFMELRAPEDFETQIFAKQFSAAAFRRELAAVPLQEQIAIGTATDPYQPAERRFRLTRGVLEVLAGERGRRLSIVTKSDLVARDADLLARIGRANVLHVNLTVTTMDERLARLVEPRAPRPDLRMGALRVLAGCGVRAGVLACPVLPCITDSYESMFAVAQAASAAGARYFEAGVVFLKPCAKAAFFPFLEREFPELVARYKARFERSAFLRGEYPEMISRRAAAIRQTLRLDRRAAAYVPEEAWESQLNLFGC